MAQDELKDVLKVPEDGSSLNGGQLAALMGITLLAALIFLYVVSG